eukprot:7987902-Alexandrium_andersonii.AAC.1
MLATSRPSSARSTGTTLSMTKAWGREPRMARTACSKSCPRSSSTPPRCPASEKLWQGGPAQ